MLSTPPAFILSQDQTLMLKVDRSSDYLAWLIDPKPSLLGFCSEFSQIQRSKPDLFSFLNFQGFTYCLIFNYQGSHFVVRLVCCNGYLLYHTINRLSTTFLFFFCFFLRSALPVRCSRGQLVYIIIIILECQPHFRRFKKESFRF